MAEEQGVWQWRDNMAGKGICTRISIPKFQKFVEELDDEHKGWVHESDLGGLLELKLKRLPRDTCVILAQNFDCKTRTCHLPSGESFKLDAYTVHRVFGLPEGGLIVEKKCSPETRAIIDQDTGFEGRMPTISQLKALITPGITRDRFMRIFMMIALTEFMCPSTSDHASPDYISALGNVRDIGEYDWSRCLLDCLVERIRQFQEALAKNDCDYLTCGGCLLLLPLALFDYVDNDDLRLKKVVPRISVWDGCTLKKFEQLNLSNIRLKDIRLTPFCRKPSRFSTRRGLPDDVQDFINKTVSTSTSSDAEFKGRMEGMCKDFYHWSLDVCFDALQPVLREQMCYMVDAVSKERKIAVDEVQNLHAEENGEEDNIQRNNVGADDPIVEEYEVNHGENEADANAADDSVPTDGGTRVDDDVVGGGVDEEATEVSDVAATQEPRAYVNSPVTSRAGSFEKSPPSEILQLRRRSICRVVASPDGQSSNADGGVAGCEPGVQEQSEPAEVSDVAATEEPRAHVNSPVPSRAGSFEKSPPSEILQLRRRSIRRVVASSDGQSSNADGGVAGREPVVQEQSEPAVALNISGVRRGRKLTVNRGLPPASRGECSKGDEGNVESANVIAADYSDPAINEVDRSDRALNQTGSVRVKRKGRGRPRKIGNVIREPSEPSNPAVNQLGPSDIVPNEVGIGVSRPTGRVRGRKSRFDDVGPIPEAETSKRSNVDIQHKGISLSSSKETSVEVVGELVGGSNRGNETSYVVERRSSRVVNVPTVLSSPSVCVSMPRIKVPASEIEKKVYNALARRKFSDTGKELGPVVARIGSYYIDDQSFSSGIRPRNYARSDLMDVYCEALNADTGRKTNEKAWEKYCLTSQAVMRLKENKVEVKRLAKILRKDVIAADLGSVEMIMIPVCEDNHWWLIVANMKDGRLFVTTRVCTNFWKFYGATYKHKNIMDAEKFPIHYLNSVVQTNNFDCGIFVMRFMKLWTGRNTMQISQERTLIYCQQIAYYIISHPDNTETTDELRNLITSVPDEQKGPRH